MDEFEFTIDIENQSKRVDLFLVGAFNERFSRSFIQGLLRGGFISVNGDKAKTHYKVRLGDVIYVKVPAPTALNVEPENIPIEILYEDTELLVINKPAGMVVHPGAGICSGTVVNALLYHCKKLSGINGVLRPGIVHRLDKFTSGLMVVAKTDLAHRFLAKQFKNHTIKKEYIAFVKNNIELDEGQIDMPIGRHSRHRQKMSATFNKGARQALTYYKVLKRFNGFTVVRLYPQTGRTHQLRVHMAYIGHPIMGDSIYGRKDTFPRQALHAKTLGFVHPGTNKFMEFNSELAGDMQDYIKMRKGLFG